MGTTKAEFKKEAERRICEIWGWNMFSLTKPEIVFLLDLMAELGIELEETLLQKEREETEARRYDLRN